MNALALSASLPAAIIDRVGWAIVHSFWLCAVNALGLAMVLPLLRGASVRHFACMFTLVLTLAGALLVCAKTAPRRDAQSAHLEAVLSSFVEQSPAFPSSTHDSAQTLPDLPEIGARAGDNPATARTGPTVAAATPRAVPRPMAAWREFLAPALPWLSAGWLAGVLLLSLRHLGGWSRVQAWQRTGKPLTHHVAERLAADIRRKLGLRRLVPIVESADVVTPMLAGIFRPIILLPLRVVTGFREGELEAILAHELAHLARGDAWANFAQLLCETTLFYHPAVWWMSRQARIERENAADDLAIIVCADRVQYANALARLAEHIVPGGLALAASDGSLIDRVRRIVAPRRQAATAASGWVAVVLILASLAGSILLVLPAASATADERPTIKVTPGASIQKAIDEAPAGAGIQSAGEGNEGLAIRRSLTADSLPEIKLEIGLFGLNAVGLALDEKTFEWRFARAETLPKSSNSLSSRANAEAAPPTQDPVKTWISDAFQLDDAAKRTAAIERIRTAMQSANVEEARAGAKAFVQLGAIEFDKGSFRPVVRALLGSTDAPTRAAAATAFTMTGAEADDLERILALADDPAPEVREPLTHIIVRLTKGDLTGKPASNAILKLMNNLPRDSRSVAHAMWGVKFSPEIEARVLEFCREIPAAGNSIVGYNFFYGALSTQANKSEASCRRLIELLAHQDTTNIAGRSAWGLQQGVAREQFPLVADAMVKVVEARSDGYLRDNALRCLRTYGDARNAPALRTLLAKPGVTGEFRKLLEETAASLEARTPAVATVAAAEANLVAQQAPANAAAAANPQAGAAIAASQDTLVRNEALVEQNRRAARLRAAEDRRNYSPEQLQEIETLYQVANTKGKRTAEARASLKQLLEKYDKANRTGCATLYLGQASVGAERLEYLTRAVEKFSDCYYFNGCQVGGYGRYVLALTLWENGQKDKARALLEELKTKYKDATDHRGVPMRAIAIAVEKELAKQK